MIDSLTLRWLVRLCAALLPLLVNVACGGDRPDFGDGQGAASGSTDANASTTSTEDTTDAPGSAPGPSVGADEQPGGDEPSDSLGPDVNDTSAGGMPGVSGTTTTASPQPGQPPSPDEPPADPADTTAVPPGPSPVDTVAPVDTGTPQPSSPDPAPTPAPSPTPAPAPSPTPTTPPVPECSSSGQRMCQGNVAVECQGGMWTEVEMCALGCTGAGDCTGLCDSVLCMAPMCKVEGTCDTNTGSCSTPTDAPPGTSCDDGDKCTQTDSCQSGSCMGSNPVTCAAGGACKVAGTCDPATGSCSSASNAPNGSSCDDNDACTISDSCQDGDCKGTQVLCNSPPVCKQSTTCSQGQCNYTRTVPDGTFDAQCPSNAQYCSGGNCVQCTDDSHCSGTTPSCRSQGNSCVCRLPSSGNLLVNPGFDGSFTGWSTFNTCGLVTDSEQCAGSSAAKIPGDCQPTQCVRLSPGSYTVGGRFKADAGTGIPYYFWVYLYSDQNCANQVDDIPATGGNQSAGAAWTSDSSTFTVPSGVKSVKVEVWAMGVLADQLFLGTTGKY